ncbi:MAG: hypothetical protein KAS21_03305 [Candidatus Aminicenantes bacterium]|nr:hypothetical protein [Candidatus Aminicenantes bacterium]
MKRTIEISLKNLEVKENGSIRNEEGNNYLTFSFYQNDHPLNPVIKELRLRDKVPIDFKRSTNPITKRRYDELERLVVKTEINEYVWINILLTDVINPNKIDSFLDNAIKFLFNHTIGAISCLVTNPFMKIPIGVSSKEAGKLLDKKSNKIFVIGEVKTKLKISDLADIGEEKPHPFKLIVPSDVYRSIIIKERGRQTKETQKVLGKGDKNGTLILSIKTLA